MKHIAIIPARCGSKGLPDKNIRELNGKPLIAHAIEQARESGCFDTVMVSTDSERYAGIAREYGADVPFLRSERTASDTASSWDVVREVLSGYEKLGRTFDTVCLLQPTSPLRTGADIAGAYALLNEKNADAVTSVCECEHPVDYMMTLPEDRSLIPFREKAKDLPRQMRPPYYRLNGAVYIRRISYENGNTDILCDSEFAYIMEKNNSVDIDTIDDFEYAEFLMKKTGNL